MTPTARRPPISPTSDPVLERALRDELERRRAATGSLGELEPLAIRLGLMQASMAPRLDAPDLMLFAADHGLVVDGIEPIGALDTASEVRWLLDGRLPLAVFARQQGLKLTVVDAGVAVGLPPHDRLLVRKIAHGSRNARVSSAMSLEQAHAAIRAGMEIGDTLGGQVVACAGIGVGAHEAAALVISRLTDTAVRDLLLSGPDMNADLLAHLMVIAQGALGRHRTVVDPVEVLAALGGFDIAMMVGVMLVAAGRRRLLMVDGMAALAALLVAARIAPPVTDYCVFCRSRAHLGLDRALGLFRASALLELALDCTDGTGAALAWPLVRSAAALLGGPPGGEGGVQPDV